MTNATSTRAGGTTACLRKGWMTVLAGLLLAVAVDAAALSRVSPGKLPALGSDEGLLLVAIDTNMPLEAVHIRKDGKVLAAGVLSRLPEGRTLRLYTAPAGRYRWSQISAFLSVRYRLSNLPDYEFDVKPGQITYVGDLVFRPTGLVGADIHLANRGLTALDWLETEHPALFQRYPFAYVGHYADPFPEFYRALRPPAAGKPAAFTPMQKPPAPRALALAPTDLWRVDHVTSVAMSPSGELLALQTRVPGKDSWSLELIDLASGDARPIVRSDFPLTAIEWSGDRSLVVSMGQSGSPQVVNVINITTDAGGRRSFQRWELPVEGRVLDVLPNDPGHILLSTLDGHRKLLVHKVDISSERAMRAFSPTRDSRLNNRIDNDIGWLTDGTGELRLALVRKDDDVVLMHRGAQGFNEVLSLKADGGFRPMTLSWDGNIIYGITDDDRAQAELVAFDTATRSITKTLFAKQGIDVVAPLLDSRRNPTGVQYYQSGRLVSEYFDQKDRNRADILGKAFAGKTVAVIDQNHDASQLVLWVDSSDQPPQLFHLDTVKRQASLLADVMPTLAKHPFAPSIVVSANSKDGMPIEGFLTLPPGAGKRPLVVMAHGGPVGVSDNLHFDRDVQFLASLGYAVLRVNFRGSGGQGKAFREAGYRNYGTLIEDDIDTMLQKVLAEQPVDASRMCAVGFSYGGYSALVSAIRWPERFRCVVSVAGISDRMLFFTASDSARSKAGRERMEKIIGDPTTQQAEMMETSPLYRYREIRVPVMLAHGEADERVDFEHTRRLQRLLDIAGKPAVGLTFRNAGHGFNYDDTHTLWNGIAGFLQQHLDRPTSATAVPATAQE